jgi:hypothetical protein
MSWTLTRAIHWRDRPLLAEICSGVWAVSQPSADLMAQIDTICGLYLRAEPWRLPGTVWYAWPVQNGGAGRPAPSGCRPLTRTPTARTPTEVLNAERLICATAIHNFLLPASLRNIFCRHKWRRSLPLFPQKSKGTSADTDPRRC